MNRRAIVPLLVGLGIGLVAVKFAINTIRKAQASSESSKAVTVVRTKLDIAAHEEIQKDMIETVETADSLFAPANERMDKLETAIGRVTAKAIPKNAPVLLSMLAPVGTRPGMVGRIPSGYRAVSVKIDEVSGVAYQMQPGDWVDVIVVMDIDAGTKGKKETIAEVILQHIQVAAIGYGSNPEPDSNPSKMKPAKSATLLVPEEEVPKLHLAGTRGKITLAMRGEDDQSQNSPTVAYGSEIMKGTTPEPPVAVVPPVTRRLPPPESDPHSVMVFHGATMTGQLTTLEHITFENAWSSRIMAMAQGAPTQASATITGTKDRGRTRPTQASDEAGGSANGDGTEAGSDVLNETPGD